MARMRFLLLIAIALCYCIQPARPTDDEEVVVMRAVRGLDARLPCGQGKVFLDGPDSYVLWLKNDRDFIYRFPNRESYNRSSNGIFGSLCDSGPCEDETSLLVKNIREVDEGVYRCRVHYQASPSVDYYIDVRVVDAPGTPKLFDGTGVRIESGYIGPLTLGSELTLVCEVEDTDLDTLVYWRRNGEMIERAQSVRSGLLRAEVKITNLTRNDHDAHYECLANNGDITEPSTVGIVVKMILPPISIRINIEESRYFEAGQPRLVDCIVVGCIPPPTITWLLGADVLGPNLHSEKHDGYYTMSSLNLTPFMKDNYKKLTCQVHSSNKKLYTSDITILVGYPPTCVEVQAGYTTAGEVNLTVTVKSSPPPNRIQWSVNNSLVYQSNDTEIRKLESHMYVASIVGIVKESDVTRTYVTAVNKVGQQTHPCAFLNIHTDGISSEKHYPDEFVEDETTTTKRPIMVKTVHKYDSGSDGIGLLLTPPAIMCIFGTFGLIVLILYACWKFLSRSNDTPIIRARSFPPTAAPLRPDLLPPEKHNQSLFDNHTDYQTYQRAEDVESSSPQYAPHFENHPEPSCKIVSFADRVQCVPQYYL